MQTRFDEENFEKCYSGKLKYLAFNKNWIFKLIKILLFKIDFLTVKCIFNTKIGFFNYLK
jgi:hypothetical protein